MVTSTSLPNAWSLVLLGSAPPLCLAARGSWLSPSIFECVLEHFANESLMEQAEQHGSKQQRQVKFTGDRQRGNEELSRPIASSQVSSAPCDDCTTQQG